MVVEFVKLSVKEYIGVITDCNILGDIGRYTRNNYKIHSHELCHTVNTDRRLRIIDLYSAEDISLEALEGIKKYILNQG